MSGSVRQNEMETHHFIHLHASARGSLAVCRQSDSWRAVEGACPPFRAPESFISASSRISFVPVNKTSRDAPNGSA